MSVEENEIGHIAHGMKRKIVTFESNFSDSEYRANTDRMFAANADFAFNVIEMNL